MTLAERLKKHLEVVSWSCFSSLHPEWVKSFRKRPSSEQNRHSKVPIRRKQVRSTNQNKDHRQTKPKLLASHGLPVVAWQVAASCAGGTFCSDLLRRLSSSEVSGVAVGRERSNGFWMLLEDALDSIGCTYQGKTRKKH